MLSLILISSLLLPLTTAAQSGASLQGAQIEAKYDATKDTTTVSLPSIKISGAKDEYYSLHVFTSFDYPGRTFQAPEFLKFEIRSVVKGLKLNSDLYVVFLVDGETIHLSSNRWAVRNPLPGRRAIGEVIAMKMPYQTFLKLISAKEAAIRMGRTRFDLTDRHKETLRTLVRQ